MKIIFDMFGSDNGPEVLAQGIFAAMRREKGLEPVLAGDKEILSPILDKFEWDKQDVARARVEILDAKTVIANEDSPTMALKQKKDSSLVVAINALKERDDIHGMVSAGATGAVLSGGVLLLGRLEGVLRPALAPILPTADGRGVCVVDAGANMDCRPEYLVQFAKMGAAYMGSRGMESPRIGLLSVGVEDKKGNELTKEVFSLLKESGLNFLGNMEARDALSGKFDVLVCDGFVGNVLIKSVEGTAGLVVKMLKQSIMSSSSAKFGALFMKKAFERLRGGMDYHAGGGAPLLGVKKVLVKAHGSSNAVSAEAALLQAYNMIAARLPEKILANLAK
ncbi:MAG: phosphate acyltransferase PlsX [Firmicutes bacterium]|nr:phosphate acyltransferase PlsX [Bacillota bacterium]